MLLQTLSFFLMGIKTAEQQPLSKRRHQRQVLLDAPHIVLLSSLATSPTGDTSPCFCWEEARMLLTDTNHPSYLQLMASCLLGTNNAQMKKTLEIIFPSENTYFGCCHIKSHPHPCWLRAVLTVQQCPADEKCNTSNVGPTPAWPKARKNSPRSYSPCRSDSRASANIHRSSLVFNFHSHFRCERLSGGEVRDNVSRDWCNLHQVAGRQNPPAAPRTMRDMQ